MSTGCHAVCCFLACYKHAVLFNCLIAILFAFLASMIAFVFLAAFCDCFFQDEQLLEYRGLADII